MVKYTSRMFTTFTKFTEFISMNMNMKNKLAFETTPQEKYDQNVWYVLKKIKECEFHTLKNNPIEYWVFFNKIDPANLFISPLDEINILKKLDFEYKVIKILNTPDKAKDAYEKLIRTSGEILDSIKDKTAIISNEDRKRFFNIKIIEPDFNNFFNLVEDKNSELGKKQQYQKLDLVKKIVVGSLIYDIDGGIYFKKQLIKMRPEIQNLCILFMKHYKELVDYTVIKDELIDANKRSSTGFKNITKYVSELHILLRKHFKKDIIFNHEKTAYIFDIERKFKKLNKK